MHYDADILADYLHGETGPETDAAIHAHLETCVPCRALHDESAAVRDWVRAAARAEELELPAMVRARVWEAVRASEPTLLERLRAAFRPAIALPVAAALAIFAYAGVPALHPAPHPPGVAASYLFEEHAAVASNYPLADRGLVVQASSLDDAHASALIEAADTVTAAGR